MTATIAPDDDDSLKRDFTELLRLAKAGDPDALQQLHARYERLVLEGGQREELLSTTDCEGVVADVPGPATQAGDADDRARLRRVLARLTAQQREVLTLRDTDGLGFAEIAKRLGLSNADAARMRYARALVALRKAWGEE